MFFPGCKIEIPSESQFCWMCGKSTTTPASHPEPRESRDSEQAATPAAQKDSSEASWSWTPPMFRGVGRLKSTIPSHWKPSAPPGVARSDQCLLSLPAWRSLRRWRPESIIEAAHPGDSICRIRASEIRSRRQRLAPVPAQRKRCPVKWRRRRGGMEQMDLRQT